NVIPIIKRNIVTEKNENYLICKKVNFYSRKDEDLFFEWIKKIDCIDSFKGISDALYLYIACNDLHDHDLRELLALFYRYKINMKHKVNNNYLICKRVSFYSSLDEAIFFGWIKRISCIERFEGAGDELYLDIIDQELSYEDMKNLIALFYRYKINMDQLKPFV